ncbi:aldo/keto reductase [Kribbella sp. VKM Ac-2568]|uniref:aldo/keto reductase n=1 Tax=Kribbella sp. VKM Ac-2568 TaxID=2512219 RepID=UPI00104FB00A|nr:aldo/keto reductase [Kribbella sp. VKM Ac-2568]TCM50447.1 aryl-alcohol dehydrogenase-like predicted oxidoreductase [Kribbella sp. VKM Ac-2568]
MTDWELGKVRLGTDGPVVGRQGFGAMAINTGYYGPTDEAAARATLEQALAVGITLFDTADAYGDGANEQFLAPFLAAHHDEVVIATKFGLADHARGIVNDPASIRAAADASLRRLGVDHIDLYYMHRRDVKVPIEETVATMAELVQAGKVRYLGLSEVTADELRAAYAVHPIAAVQSEWSLFSRDIETQVAPAAAELGTALVPYSPLGRGVLTGAVPSADHLESDDVRRSMPRFSEGNDTANHDLLVPLRAIAAARGATLAQIALAWLHAQERVFGLPVVPIPGTRSSARVVENARGALITLTDEELAQLEPIADSVAGNRYADMRFTSAGRE